MRLNVAEQTLEQVKTEALAKIRAEKIRVRDGGVMVGVVLFDTDSRARIAYAELALRLAANPAYVVDDWKASEGVWVRMDGEMFGALMAAGEAHIAAVFTWQRLVESAVGLAATKAEVRRLRARRWVRWCRWWERLSARRRGCSCRACSDRGRPWRKM
jgi:hypothetical protein